MSSMFSALSDAVLHASENGQPLHIVGGGCHTGIGFPCNETVKAIEMRGYDAVNFYSPEELVLSVQAGARLSTLSAMLAERQQRFSCSFRNLSALFGEYRDDATLGGGIALNLSGSDRINHYAIRDSVLGLEVINAEGEHITMGGRVFKNVTGYDLSKLMMGSLGTLGIIASVNMRLRPLAETEISLCWDIADVELAVQLMARALNSPFDVCGAYAEQTAKGYRVFLRIEGFAASVRERIESLKKFLDRKGAFTISGEESWKKWFEINNLSDFSLNHSSEEIWLLTQPAAQGAQIVKALRTLSPNSRIHLDWGGAQVWYIGADRLSADDIHQVCQGYGATLRPIRVAPERAKGALRIDSVSRKLIQKLYQKFDPKNLFQRQRLYESL